MWQLYGVLSKKKRAWVNLAWPTQHVIHTIVIIPSQMATLWWTIQDAISMTS